MHREEKKLEEKGPGDAIMENAGRKLFDGRQGKNYVLSVLYILGGSVYGSKLGMVVVHEISKVGMIVVNKIKARDVGRLQSLICSASFPEIGDL